MWQRFTERARRVVFFAQEEAGRLGENYVATEHLLLGLIRENDSVAARILDQMGISLGRIRNDIEQQVTRGDSPLGRDMQLTPRAKRVVDLAYDEARQLSNNYIGTEHLLLGLIRENEGLAGRVLAALGVDLEQTREAIRELQKQPASANPQAASVTGRAVTLSDGGPMPLKGDVGVLRRHDSEAKVPLVLERADVKAYEEVMETKDDYAYREMVTAGKVVLLESGTQAKFLRREEPNSDYVRILDGEYTGKSGYVRHGYLQETQADLRPFPPEI